MASHEHKPMPPSRNVDVRGPDGTRLHTQVFGPDDGYPIVLAHGYTCAIGVWREQIADLARDHKVIAYDHRGHGRSGVPARGHYSLNHLAADLQAVLDTTLQPGQKAVLAGHSMGGMAVAAWSERYAHKVADRADGVALINSSTGDVVRQIDLLNTQGRLAGGRAVVAQRVVRHLGRVPAVRIAHKPTARLVSDVVVGADAHPEVHALMHNVVLSTHRIPRGEFGRMLVEKLDRKHIRLDALTVPTLVIGGAADRLLPIGASYRIAELTPNLFDSVVLPGGHCTILEYPDEVNRHLRRLIDTATASS
ncbi:alpha/beta fold hydrolase [Mycolicibacterium brumae]|nr:alpha/beta hydrolase [Mycolicibacterium brumae]RWA20256.1 hypothetical protein MBRU_15420 [Mycolicibacterium brumae DSM 44177]UWW09665.1 alpha/beta hydrolase [Mycolicibacterium brumae]